MWVCLNTVTTKRVLFTVLRPIVGLVGVALPPAPLVQEDAWCGPGNSANKQDVSASALLQQAALVLALMHQANSIDATEHEVPDAERCETFDWLRMFSALMVFTFHTSQPFSYNASWPIHNKEKSAWVDAFIISMDAWLMPLLMVLSGASARYALNTRSGAAFIRERTMRILLPCVVGLFTLCPPQSYLRRRLQGEFTGSFLRFYPQFFKGIYPEGNLGYYHLWFLVYLFAYAMAGLPLFVYLRSRAGQRWLARLAHVSAYPGVLFLFGVPLMLGQIALRKQFPKTYFIVNDWAFHALLFPLFIYGYVLVSDKRFMQAIDEQWIFALFPAFILTGVLYAHTLGICTLSYIMQWSLFGLSAWLWVLLTIGVGQTWLTSGGRVLNYARHATYPFYLLHQPVVATVAYYVVQRHMPMPRKWVAIHTTSFVATLGLYELGRRWSITRRMLGLKSVV